MRIFSQIIELGVFGYLTHVAKERHNQVIETNRAQKYNGTDLYQQLVRLVANLLLNSPIGTQNISLKFLENIDSLMQCTTYMLLGAFLGYNLIHMYAAYLFVTALPIIFNHVVRSLHHNLHEIDISVTKPSAGTHYLASNAMTQLSGPVTVIKNIISNIADYVTHIDESQRSNTFAN